MKNAFNKIDAKYGINIDTNMGCDAFDYMICDDYNEASLVLGQQV